MKQYDLNQNFMLALQYKESSLCIKSKYLFCSLMQSNSDYQYYINKYTHQTTDHQSTGYCYHLVTILTNPVKYFLKSQSVNSTHPLFLAVTIWSLAVSRENGGHGRFRGRGWQVGKMLLAFKQKTGMHTIIHRTGLHNEELFNIRCPQC